MLGLLPRELKLMQHLLSNLPDRPHLTIHENIGLTVERRTLGQQ